MNYRISCHDWPWWHSYAIDWIDVIGVLMAGWLLIKLAEWWWLT